MCWTTLCANLDKAFDTIFFWNDLAIYYTYDNNETNTYVSNCFWNRTKTKIYQCVVCLTRHI